MALKVGGYSLAFKGQHRMVVSAGFPHQQICGVPFRDDWQPEYGVGWMCADVTQGRDGQQQETRKREDSRSMFVQKLCRSCAKGQSGQAAFVPT
ncbi:hypothetical protein BJB45_12035 [Halomonas huangheensis]|uniref:Uncharacterized protein n=1 Tax=Halomonas huangheensis TaxID=1178482 RepID=W1N8S9_9GAMM|nr:hypothetical protein AR456_15045 [Halomonas huangheensis]ERL51889.1 hypothetical protein BJB45_12035 [Halomonas huangheensis]